MRIAVALGGTDHGLSGIGNYVRSVLPCLLDGARSLGGSVVALGTPAELAAYPNHGLDHAEIHAKLDAPIPSALWHLTYAGLHAQRAGADVLLLPAANRRMTFRSPIPTVAVVHDLAPLHVPNKYDRLRMMYVRRVLKPALRGATELVAVSRATRDDLAGALGLPDGRVHVVLNGVDARRFSAPLAGDDRIQRAKEATDLTAPYLLYAARLEHPGKNHLRLLRAYAASRAQQTHLLALAGNDWGALAMLRAEALKLGVADRVRFLGFVADEILPGLIGGATAVIMVGLREGFGLPALEALACGTPVVASSAGALPEVTGDLAAICDPLSEASIAAALDQTVFDDHLRARARRKGPAWASGFTWEATADGLLQVLLKTTSTRERSPSRAPR